MDGKGYDRVWVMRHNKPTELQVFAVVDSADYWKRGTERKYHLVDSMFGAGWGNNSGEEYHAKHVYPSKESLLAALTEEAK